ncbi:MAG: LysM peptidoglycan-binding domain-containing protein [bacterium]|nr:LysM peptidoglycan-binding domain-containing protein [bacterium]
MSCRPRDEDDWSRYREPSDRSGEKRKRLAMRISTAAAAILCAMSISSRWIEKPRETAEPGWTQMRGNDGKFWQGTPDDSHYADTEGVELRTYYQYFYDKEDRLSKVNTFRPHENYRDVWVLSNEETYQYDRRGRVSVRQETQGDTKKVYEYTAEGCTETEFSSYASAGRTAKYDQAGNQIYFRNAVNYRYPHVTRSEYDEKNRLVRKTLEVEGKEPYGVPEYVVYTAEYDEENYRSVETEYDSQGNIVYIWHSTYDENWEKEGSVWYAPEGYNQDGGSEGYTSGKESEGYDPDGGSETYTSGKESEGYDPDGGSEMHIPGKESESYDPDGGTEAHTPGKESESYVQNGWEAYATMGYWRYVSDGKLLEEMENAPWKEDRSDSEYTAYDYDDSGNCILELKVYSKGYAYLYRYVYNDENLLTERFDYNMDDVRFWEMLQFDGSRLTLQVSDDEVLSITRTAPDGMPVNRFVYGEQEVEIQQTSEETVSWRRAPSLITAEKEPETDRTQISDPEETKPEKPNQDNSSGPTTQVYIVKKGDSLWSIAEELLGDGHRYREIYRWNRDVIGDDPGRILPEMKLYLEIP